MNELIPIGRATIGGEEMNAVDARDIHAFLGVRSNYRDWIKNRIADFGFLEGTDFSAFAKNLANGGRTKEYFVSISMAKELCMVERTEKGKQARLYFIECERIAKEKQSGISIEAEKRLRLQFRDFNDRICFLEAQLKEAKIKAKYYEENYCIQGKTISEMAEVFEMRPNWLRKDLREIKWIGRDGRISEHALLNGYMTYKEPWLREEEPKRRTQLITGKGEAWLQERYAAVEAIVTTKHCSLPCTYFMNPKYGAIDRLKRGEKL